MRPRTTKVWTLAGLAEALGLPLEPSFAGIEIRGAASLDEAAPDQLAALYDPRRAEAARASAAGALIVPPAARPALGERALLAAEAPKAAFARAISLIYPERELVPGVHPSAVVAEDAELGEGVEIGPHVYIGPRARLGAGVLVGAGCVVLEDVVIGEGAELHPRVVVYPKSEIGPRCRLLAGAVIGAPGFGQARDAQGRALRVPHVGHVVLEEDVEVGANATVDRATFGVTRLGARARLDNLVQIGHNAELGEDVMIAAQSGVSGSSRLGRGVMMGGQSGLADHVAVGEGAAVAAKTAVFGDVAPGSIVAGAPAIPISRWRRAAALAGKLPELWSRVRKLEERLAAPEGGAGAKGRDDDEESGR